MLPLRACFSGVIDFGAVDLRKQRAREPGSEGRCRVPSHRRLIGALRLTPSLPARRAGAPAGEHRNVLPASTRVDAWIWATETHCRHLMLDARAAVESNLPVTPTGGRGSLHRGVGRAGLGVPQDLHDYEIKRSDQLSKAGAILGTGLIAVGGIMGYINGRFGEYPLAFDLTFVLFVSLLVPAVSFFLGSVGSWRAPPPRSVGKLVRACDCLPCVRLREGQILLHSRLAQRLPD